MEQDFADCIKYLVFVLGYISSDILKSGLRAIYTDYHELGSLHDYLDKTCLNYTDFFRLVRSAATAIAHLHTEILGTSKLPAVAHCDITSKNFFVNNDKECVISNFEISVVHIR
jgi:tRNA A-37 threonylcarbamoyl transferase component Bud32